MIIQITFIMSSASVVTGTLRVKTSNQNVSCMKPVSTNKMFLDSKITKKFARNITSINITLFVAREKKQQILQWVAIQIIFA